MVQKIPSIKNDKTSSSFKNAPKENIVRHFANNDDILMIDIII